MIRAALESVAAAADAAGLASTARDIRETRIPKLDEERFTLVVLGEFNHGKSTFINALLAEAVLPTGITPTTAVLDPYRRGDAARGHADLRIGRAAQDRGRRARRLAHRRGERGPDHQRRPRERPREPSARACTTSS